MDVEWATVVIDRAENGEIRRIRMSYLLDKDLIARKGDTITVDVKANKIHEAKEGE